MSKKRRMFDVDLPDDVMPDLEVKSMGGFRRGPMATAIGENADALRRRQTQEAEIRAENDTLAHEFVRLKKLGLITDLIPIDQVQANKLQRDRSRRADADLDDLVTSIREVGLSNPIRVEQTGPTSYELVQGWRRLSAYRALYAQTGDAIYARIPAGLMAKGETLESLYRRMVDENMVRKDISFAEMANLARAYADDRATGCVDVDQAVNLLFASAVPQKRSYIRRFASLMRMLEKSLEHPEAIPRALGLGLAQRFEETPGLAAQVSRALQTAGLRTAEQELAILRGFVEGQGAPMPERRAAVSGGSGGTPRGKTTLRLPRPEGEARCTASPGKVELRLNIDFSALERAKLEAAVTAFFVALD